METTTLIGTTQGWADTGISLDKGDTLRVTAQGIIKFASKVPGSNGYPRDPDGRDEHGNIEWAGAGWPAPGKIRNSLVLQIGGIVEQGGTFKEIKIQQAGSLQICNNDDNSHDNDGYWTIKFEVKKPVPAPSSNVRNMGNVCVVENDKTGKLVRSDNSVDYAEAYRLFRTINPDTFDFVTFFHDYNPSDAGSFPRNWPSNSMRIWREIQGLGKYENYPTYVIDERKNWGTVFLKSVQMMDSDKFPADNLASTRTLLHEIGHHWLCYAPYIDPVRQTPAYDCFREPAAPYAHWSDDMAVGASPMTYTMRKWDVTATPGVYAWEGLSKYLYGDLELYLMGLLDPGKVAPFFLLKNKQVIPGVDATQYYKADKIDLTVNDFIKANGPLVPSSQNSQKQWKHAFVILTNSIAGVGGFLSKVDSFRQQWEGDFAEATRYLGKIDTKLS